ncbi:MAG: aquaporin family protein [Desulfovibrio sp.]|nr:aquaporin family protein [Desulfovibrio sp.]
MSFSITTKEFFGEFAGTFLLVLFGCGSVAVSVLFDAHSGLMQIGIIWGIGVTLAVYATRNLSCAHLNPAVTAAMVAAGRMRSGKLPGYWLAQMLGAIIAGFVLYACFGSSIETYELAHKITRGSPESAAVAKMFGEYYNLPGSNSAVGMWLAAFVELLGTFLLLMLIFSITEGCNVGKPSSDIEPVFIGLSVTSIICLLAPLTQAGLNPARDFGPRLVSWAMGWGSAAFPDETGGFFIVYIAAPIVGGVLAAWLFKYFIDPLLGRQNTGCCCK